MRLPGPTTSLVAVRLGLGGISWASPQTLVKALGVKDDDDPVTLWMARMFAVRDAILGVGVICTKGEQRRFWLKIGLACDIADLAGGVIAARHHTKRNTVLKFTPLIGIGLGVAALKEQAT